MDDMAESPPDDDRDPMRVAPDEAHAPGAVRSLKQAMRRARSDNAERCGAIADLRASRMARLEVLAEALRPLSAQIPADVDLFDFGLMPGANPRLFIDMIGFVEMGRDARLYRLLQDSRHGRTTIAESAEVDTMVEAVTDYVARRLLERDQALASDATPQRRPADAEGTPDIGHIGKASGPMHAFGVAFAFVIDLLGSIAFFTILAGLAWLAWTHWRGQGG